ncbi:MAG: hypothetical protein L6277_17535 [Desulfobacterales bacterium]|nr:hypothetical protein [Pseudomonadota bacterium]MBU4354848.1 hypothetical protein [Pseudomonadota bacterium]MCG2773875.1 hypothetical protein [Desulfobacterales bacterium]
MGLLGPSKVKIRPNDFVKNQLNKIFSTNFIDAEEKGFANLSKEISMFKMVSLDKYLKERQNVICNLLQLAWDRTVPYDIFIEYSGIMLDDPRVRAVYSGAYDMCLSKAEKAGMDTFGYISMVFLTQIIPQDVEINDIDHAKLYQIYGTEFTSLYISLEALIKGHKFIK